MMQQWFILIVHGNNCCVYVLYRPELEEKLQLV